MHFVILSPNPSSQSAEKRQENVEKCSSIPFIKNESSNLYLEVKNLPHCFIILTRLFIIIRIKLCLTLPNNNFINHIRISVAFDRSFFRQFYFALYLNTFRRGGTGLPAMYIINRPHFNNYLHYCSSKIFSWVSSWETRGPCLII